jgi:cGMP-dependent protein kinase
MLEMFSNAKIIKSIKPQDGFGELALLYRTERTSTVTAREACSMWAIDRQTFREAVEEVIIREYNENRRCIDKVKIFHNLNNDQKDIIASALSTQKFNKD